MKALFFTLCAAFAGAAAAQLPATVRSPDTKMDTLYLKLAPAGGAAVRMVLR